MSELMSEELVKEYDEVFKGEEGLQNMLTGIKSEVTISEDVVELGDIIIPEFKKNSRADTVIGLSGLITKFGILNPVHVLKLEDDNRYMLLDGLRRMFSAKRNKAESIKAYIWKFTDVDEGKAKANLVSLMLNRSQLYTPKEQWNMLQILEGVNNFTPGTIEYLLQMNLGDAMKLKDVMLSDNEYDEVKEKLMNGETSIDAAYKKIMNMRKKEDRLSKDDMKAMEITEEGEFATSQKTRLDVEEVIDLLDMGTSFNDADVNDLESLNMTNEVRGTHVQDTNDRHIVDKEIKQGTFMRDKFTCQCCLTFGGEEDLTTLVYHHLIPVSAGGPDTVKNGLTLCGNCHMLLHNYVTGDIVVDVNTLTEEKRERFKRIFFYGNFAIKAYKQIGLKKREEFKERDTRPQHVFPATYLKENREIYKTTAKQE